MTQDEIIEMARQAGGKGLHLCTDPTETTIAMRLDFEQLETFAKMVFELGFFAGFEASGEGFNGEYPYLDKSIDIKTDKYVLHALKEARGEA